MGSPVNPAADATVPLPRLLLVLVPAMLLIPITSDMVSLVLPSIADQFAASTAQVAWLVTGFLLACAVGIPIYGRMADRYGLRLLFTAALAAFAAGSLICAVAPNLVLLVLGRILTGAGGAAIPVLVIVAAVRLLPREKSAIGVGFIAAAGGAGTALGPAIGGGLGQALGWRALFWIMTIAAVLLIPAIRRVLTDPPTRRGGRLDVLGGTLLGASAGLVLFGITQAEGTRGFTGSASWGPLLAGLLAGGLVAWRTRTAAQPFVPPSLFAHRGYLAAVSVIFLAMMVNLTALVLLPLLLIEVNGLTPAQGSLVMIPGGIALAVLSPLVGRLGARGVNGGAVALVGLAVIAISMLVLSTIAGASPVLAGLAILTLGAGFALVVTPVTSAVSQLLPPAHIGTGVGIFQGAQFLGAGAGPALFGVVLSVRQSGASEAVNPLDTGLAAAYSDTFLVLALVGVPAMGAALRLRTVLAARTQQRPEPSAADV
ncbi:MFS transporter [Polymorphospora rubra]|uniref:MFS transporter n=1 Tax=Polymorphospora rubra TaxID=338584 RepID=UPI001BB35D99|nr:MFS transporter [Polymorphospora rubra]